MSTSSQQRLRPEELRAVLKGLQGKTDLRSTQTTTAASHTYDNYRDRWDKFDIDAALRSVDGDSAQPPKNQRRAPPSQRPPPPAASPADTHREQGNAHFKAGRWQDALDCYTRSIDVRPTSAAFANRALAALKLKNYSAAEDDCTQALTLEPQYVKAFLRRGTARRELGNVDGAIRDFEAALRLEPTNKTASDERKQSIAQSATTTATARFEIEQVPVVVCEEQESLLQAVSIKRSSNSSVKGGEGSAATQAPAVARVQVLNEDDGDDDEAMALPPLMSNDAVPVGFSEEEHLGSSRVGTPVPLLPAETGNMKTIPLPQQPIAAQTRASPTADINTLHQTSINKDVAVLDSAEPSNIPPQQQRQPLVAEAAPRSGGDEEAEMITAVSSHTIDKQEQNDAFVTLAVGGQPSNSSGGGGGGANNQTPQTGASHQSAATAVPSTLQPQKPHCTTTSIPTRKFSPPKTGVEFERVWRGLKGDASKQSEYLSMLDASQLPSLLKQALTSALLSDMLHTLLRCTVFESPAAVVSVLAALPQVPRFAMNVLSLSSTQKKELSGAWDDAIGKLSGSGGDKVVEQLKEVRKSYLKL